MPKKRTSLEAVNRTLHRAARQGCNMMNTYIQRTLEDRRYGDFDSTGS